MKANYLLFFTIILNMSVFAQTNSSTYLPKNTIQINYQNLGFSSATSIRNKRGIAIEPSGNIWIGLAANGLIYWDGSTWTAVKDTISGTYLPSDSIHTIKHDSNYDLWVASNFGLSYRTLTGYNNFAFNSAVGFPPTTINEIEISGNLLYLATTSGFIKFDISSQIFTHYNQANSALLNDTISSITLDSQGKVWLSTNEGFSIYDNGSISNINYLNSALPNCAIYDIAFTANDTILISSTSGIIRKINQQYISLDSIYNYSAKVTADFCSSPFLYDGSDSTFKKYSFSSRLMSNGNKIFLLINQNQDHIASIEPNSIKIHPEALSNNTSILNSIFSISNDTIYFSNAVVYLYVNNVFKVSSQALNSIPEEHLATKPFQISNFANQIIPKSYVGIDGENLVGNMITARIHNRGNLHLDPYNFNPTYEVPFNSGKNSVYASAIWLGGLDNSNQLYTAAQTYRQNSSCDFFPGPLDTLAQIDSTTFHDFDHIWMARKSDIDEFRYQYAIGNVTAGIYQIPDFILNWPAYYNKPRFPQRLAPFIDINADNEYNPYDGDYPDVKGEQMAWWIFNDALATKTETNSLSMGVEIQASAYSFNCNNQSNNSNILNATTFYHFDLYNRSNKDYHSFYFGMWSDSDLGNGTDDAIQCNITNNSFMSFNGDSIDDGANGYQSCPPVQNVTILKGPEATLNDNIDNNHNGIIDEPNEDIGLSHFVYYYGANGSIGGNPNAANDYYNYLKALWLDGSNITYGGDGHGGGIGSTFTPTDFMFPGNTDPNFSTSWTMLGAGFPPDDIRGVGSVGPFDLPAGSMKSFDIAFITGPSNYGPGGMALNDSIVANIRNQFRSGTLDNFQGSMPSISGPAFTAALNTYSYTLPIQLNAGSTVIWNVQNGTIISGQGSNSINVLWGSIGAGTVSVELLNSNACKAVDTLHVKIGTVGLTQNIQDDFVRVYPNPTSSILNIETKDHKIALCEIRNLQGQIVSHQTYSQSIDIQNLTDGVYFILLLDNNQKVLSRKLVVKE
jgi:hypothetical protein